MKNGQSNYNMTKYHIIIRKCQDLRNLLKNGNNIVKNNETLV